MDKHLERKLDSSLFDMDGNEHDPSEIMLRAKKALEGMDKSYTELLRKGRDVSTLKEKMGALCDLYNMCRCLVADRVTIGLYMRLHEQEIIESKEIKAEWKKKYWKEIATSENTNGQLKQPTNSSGETSEQSQDWLKT